MVFKISLDKSGEWKEEAAIAVRKRENMVLEVVIDGVPYAEEAYVKDPIQYLMLNFFSSVCTGLFFAGCEIFFCYPLLYKNCILFSTQNAGFPLLNFAEYGILKN